MFKPFIKNRKAKLLLICAMALPSSVTLAAKADFDQQIVIQAKRQASDLKNKIASYLDDVFISQGSLTIKADLVQVFSQPDSEHKVYLATGKPAIFEQLLDDGTPINLQANEIKYQPELHTITISGNARVSQQGSVVSGSRIIYNTLTEQLSAESDNEQTVTTILQPKGQGDN